MRRAYRVRPTPAGLMSTQPVLRAEPATHTGLSQAEAHRRLRQDGPNELPQREGRGLLHTAIEVLREPMILLLVGAGAVYLFLGDREEAILLLGSIGLIVGIELYQERRTEHALEALRDLSSPRALVIRDGEQRRIPGREVVRDDVLVLGEGDRVPADAVLLWCTNLAADESLLTGESVPVRKAARPPGEERGAARRRRPALRVLGNAGHQRPGRGSRGRNRSSDRDGPHRLGAPDAGHRAHAPAAGDGPRGPPAGGRWRWRSARS